MSGPNESLRDRANTQRRSIYPRLSFQDVRAIGEGSSRCIQICGVEQMGSGQDLKASLHVCSPEQGSHAALSLASPCEERRQCPDGNWRHQRPTWCEILRRIGRKSLRKRWLAALQKRWKRRQIANQEPLDMRLARADAYGRPLPPLLYLPAS